MKYDKTNDQYPLDPTQRQEKYIGPHIYIYIYIYIHLYPSFSAPDPGNRQYDKKNPDGVHSWTCTRVYHCHDENRSAISRQVAHRVCVFYNIICIYMYIYIYVYIVLLAIINGNVIANMFPAHHILDDSKCKENHHHRTRDDVKFKILVRITFRIDFNISLMFLLNLLRQVPTDFQNRWLPTTTEVPYTSNLCVYVCIYMCMYVCSWWWWWYRWFISLYRYICIYGSSIHQGWPPTSYKNVYVEYSK